MKVFQKPVCQGLYMPCILVRNVNLVIVLLAMRYNCRRRVLLAITIVKKYRRLRVQKENI